MNATWLFAEAYKYRRLRECFSVSKYWKDYDVFLRQKVCGIKADASSRVAPLCGPEIKLLNPARFQTLFNYVARVVLIVAISV